MPGNKIYNPQDQNGNPLAWVDKNTGKIPESLLPAIKAGIDISYNGNIIEQNVTEMNFEGNYAQVSKTGEGKVNILVQENANPSNFGTQDGITDARLSRNPSANNSYTITSPTTEGNPFKIGSLTPGQPYARCLANGTTQLVYTVAQSFYCATNNTSLNIKLLDADGTSELLSGSFIINGNGTKTDGTITVVTSGFIANTGAGQNGYSAKVVITIPLAASFPNGGKLSINITHVNNGVNYSSNDDNLFLPKAVTPAIGTTNTDLTVALKTPVTKVISGVPYLDKNSVWTIGMNNITNVNNNVRLNASSTIISLTPTTIGVPVKNYTGSTLTSSPINLNNVYNTSITGITEDFNLTNGVILNGPTNTTASITNLVAGSTRTTSITARIWSNYGTPTDLLEPFGNEAKRLKSDGITAWDSSESLTTNDGLQFYNNTLVYPSINFSPVSLPAGGPNYSTITNDRTFYRIYKVAGDNNARANGTFSIANITESDMANTALKLEMQLLGGDSTWWDLKKTKGDGLGVRITAGFTLPNLRFSLPTGTTFVASTGVLFRVTMTKAYTKPINSLNLVIFE